MHSGGLDPAREETWVGKQGKKSSEERNAFPGKVEEVGSCWSGENSFVPETPFAILISFPNICFLRFRGDFCPSNLKWGRGVREDVFSYIHFQHKKTL